MAVDFMKRRKEMLEDIVEQFLKIDQAPIDELVDAILKANRIYTSGWGRAGNIVRILGMNMSQLGRLVYCVGDNGTPSIKPDDLLIIFSGSGNTKTISLICQQAKDQGATVALISGGGKESTMGKIADIVVEIPRLPRGEQKEGNEPAPTRGLSIYQTAFILNEYIEDCVMYKTGQTMEDIIKNHNNLE